MGDIGLGVLQVEHPRGVGRAGALALLSLVAVALSAVVSVDVGSARVRRDGGEFQISPVVGRFDYYGTPDIVASDDGSFLVVWAGAMETDPTADVFVQRFGSGGATDGATFQVNEPSDNLDSDAESPDIVLLDSSRIAVAWTTRDISSSDELEIVVRLYDLAATPTPVTPEILVNTYATGKQFLHSIAETADGGFVIAWVDAAGELGLGEHNIAAQRFDRDGVRVGTEFAVPESGSQFRPSVPEIQARSDGGFVVVWSSDYSQDGDNETVVGRVFAADSTPVAAEFQVNTQTVGGQYVPDIAIMPDDGFVVAWANRSHSGVSSNIIAQRFDSAALKIGTEFTVSQNSATSSNAPDIAAFDDGSFVVVWRNDDGQEAGDYCVVGRRFSVSGEPDGTEFVVNTYTTGAQGRGSSRDSFNVAALSDSSFVVVWDSRGQQGQGSAVVGQRYCVMSNGLDACGDASCPPNIQSGALTASDALFVLRAAVGFETCPACVCDANGSSTVTAVDALVVLRSATGLSATLACPACQPESVLE
jgi:hypothetical protein